MHYRNPDVDRLIEECVGGDRRRAPRRLYAEAQQLIAEDVPYISLWYRTNVAIFQPDIRGVSLSPIADYAFLRNVYRDAAAPSAH